MFRYSGVLIIMAFMPVAYNQLFTFKDGKIGVNFFGYTAEAGLGGLLTGNAAHGGLSASAGTPFGQKAAAGLGGTVDEKGRPMGGGFAAASAGAGVGASAALGGRYDEQGGQGGLGSEAHAAGFSTKKVEVSQFPQQLTIPQNVKAVEFGPLNPRVFNEQDDTGTRYERRRLKTKYVQQQNDERNKISKLDSRFNDEDDDDVYEPPARRPANDYRQFFDFGYFSDLAASISGAPDPATQSGYAIQIRKQKTPNTVSLEKIVTPDLSRKTDVKTITKEIIREDTGSRDENNGILATRRKSFSNSGTAATTRVNFQQNPNFFNDIFNIPISALNAVNQFLNNGLLGTSVSKTKTVEYRQS